MTILNDLDHLKGSISTVELYAENFYFGTLSGGVYSLKNRETVLEHSGDDSGITNMHFDNSLMLLTEKGNFFRGQASQGFGPDLKKMAWSKDCAAFGGEEKDLKIIDLASGSLKFEAENVDNDFLDMRQPISITDIQFRDFKSLATATKYHQVRLYDQSVGKKPTSSYEIGDCPIKCISFLNENVLCVGNVKGNIFKVDLRNGRVLKKFEGSVGCITSLSSFGELIVSTSLDRHLYVHNVEHKNYLNKIYLKQKINAHVVESWGDDCMGVTMDRDEDDDMWEIFEKV